MKNTAFMGYRGSENMEISVNEHGSFKHAGCNACAKLDLADGDSVYFAIGYNNQTSGTTLCRDCATELKSKLAAFLHEQN